MQIQNRFEVPMAAADAWIFLMNIPVSHVRIPLNISMVALFDKSFVQCLISTFLFI